MFSYEQQQADRNYKLYLQSGVATPFWLKTNRNSLVHYLEDFVVPLIEVIPFGSRAAQAQVEIVLGCAS